MEPIDRGGQQFPNNGLGWLVAMQIGEFVEIPLDGSRRIAAHGPLLYGVQLTAGYGWKEVIWSLVHTQVIVLQ